MFSDANALLTFFTFCCRIDGNGSTYDVHHSVPNDRERRAQRLEAPNLGLWVVIRVGVWLIMILNCKHTLGTLINLHYRVLLILSIFTRDVAKDDTMANGCECS